MNKKEKQNILTICNNTGDKLSAMQAIESIKQYIAVVEEDKAESNMTHYRFDIKKIFFSSILNASNKIMEVPALDCEQELKQALYKAYNELYDFYLMHVDEPNKYFTNEFVQEDLIDWLADEYKNTNRFELSKFEYDLLATNDQSHNRKLKTYQTYLNMKKAGYFKNIDFNLTIKEVLKHAIIKGD